MSANTEAHTQTQEAFQEDASGQHLTAFFNPFKQYRENALKQIRASSGWSPEAWEKLDAAAGIPVGEEREEVEASSPMPYGMGVNFEADGLDEQFVRSPVMDMLANSGFGISASLSDYVYARPLKSGRMEAETAMNPRSDSTQDSERNGLDGIPLPVNFVTYKLDGREMEVRRAYGDDPEERPAREARRALNRREHSVLFNGWGGQFESEAGVFTIGGIDSTDTDKVLQATASSGWNTDPNNLLDDIDALHNTVEQQSDVVDTDDVPLVSEVGGIVLVPNKLWGNVSRENYETSATDEPITDRLQRKYPYLTFMPAPRLDDDTAILMLNDPRYFGVVNAQGVTNTAWDIDGGAARKFRLVSSRIPWVRAQPDGVNGIARITGISA